MHRVLMLFSRRSSTITPSFLKQKVIGKLVAKHSFFFYHYLLTVFIFSVLAYMFNDPRVNTNWMTAMVIYFLYFFHFLI